MDVAQDVFALVWERKKFTMDEEHLKAYIFNAVRNACFNYLKHKKVIHKYQEYYLTQLELDYYKNGEKSLIEKENLNKIYGAINSLSPIYFEVIKMSRFEKLKNKEIAESLHISVRTVETRLFRALSLLKDKLSEKTFYLLLNITYLSNI